MIMDAEKLKQYINSRPALNRAALAKEIGYSTSSFHQWYTGTRKLPEAKAKALAQVLAKYGLQVRLKQHEHAT
jgi:DNA-binding transcriptional regulator YdaS (Cro superfamily)